MHLHAVALRRALTRRRPRRPRRLHQPPPDHGPPISSGPCSKAWPRTAGGCSGRRDVRGQRLSPVRIIGGGAQSDLWCQIHADVLDRTVEQVADPMDAQLRGMAALAAVAWSPHDGGGGRLATPRDGVRARRRRQICTPVPLIAAETSVSARSSPSSGNSRLPPPTVTGSTMSRYSSTRPAPMSARAIETLPMTSSWPSDDARRSRTAPIASARVEQGRVGPARVPPHGRACATPRTSAVAFMRYRRTGRPRGRATRPAIVW